jgi:hypothetical protein
VQQLFEDAATLNLPDPGRTDVVDFDDCGTIVVNVSSFFTATRTRNTGETIQSWISQWVRWRAGGRTYMACDTDVVRRTSSVAWPLSFAILSLLKGV